MLHVGCRHPQPGRCLACTETPAASATRASLGLTLYAAAEKPNSTAKAAALLKTIRTVAAPAIPTAAPLPRFPTHLTPGVGGSWKMVVKALAKLSKDDANSILNSSQWDAFQRKCLAEDILREQRGGR